MFCSKTTEVCEKFLNKPNLIVTSLSSPGKTQSHKQGIRHEAAEQVWDDQEVGLCFLLGGEGHHGFCQQRMGGAGMMWRKKTSKTHLM